MLEMPGSKTKTENLVTQGRVMELIAQGKSHKYITDLLQEDGMTYKNASAMYYNTLKTMLPNPEWMEDYKRAITQTNIDRLEKIIDDTLSGDTASKNTAIRAIEVINKMVGLTGENKVNIAKNSQGDEVIQITFGS